MLTFRATLQLQETQLDSTLMSWWIDSRSPVVAASRKSFKMHKRWPSEIPFRWPFSPLRVSREDLLCERRNAGIKWRGNGEHSAPQCPMSTALRGPESPHRTSEGAIDRLLTRVLRVSNKNLPLCLVYFFPPFSSSSFISFPFPSQSVSRLRELTIEETLNRNERERERERRRV